MSSVIFERKKKSASFGLYDCNKITFHESDYTIEEVEQILEAAKEKLNENKSNV